MYRNRAPSTNGVAHGGVAVVARDSVTKMKGYDFPNPDDFEVLAVAATVASIKRKLFILAAYIPPNYTVGRGNRATIILAT